MHSPAVSVAMVVRNMERFVGEAVESILNQTYRDFEFIIVDFGSIDQSRAIISSYQAQDRRVRLEVVSPCSLPEARNASCGFARGRYIALMDADDVSFPERLERQVAYLEKHPEVALLGSAIKCTGPSGAPRFTRDFPLTDADIREALTRGTVLHQTTVMFRREVLDVVKGYRKAFPLAEDYDLWLRVIEHFQVANLPEPLVYYRIHSGQVSVQKLRHEITCSVAARAAAKIRASGGVDPLWEAEDITPAVLARLGVDSETLIQALATGFCDWMNAMLQVSNDEAALRLIDDLLELPRASSVSSAILSNACLDAARLHYRRRSYVACLNYTAKAIRVRPWVVGRPAKRVLDSALAALTHNGRARAGAPQ